MALTRKMLKALGLSEEHIETIVEAHVETVTALTRERDDFKVQAESLEAVTKERDSYKEQAEKAGDAAKVQAEFDAYKQQIETEKTNAAKTTAVRKALKDAGAHREEFVELLMGKVDLDKVEMDGDAVKDSAALVDPLKTSYAGCFGTPGSSPVPPADPPTGGKQTPEDPFIKGFDE